MRQSRFFRNPTPEPITPPFGNPDVTWEPYTLESFNTFFMAQSEGITNVGDYSQKGIALWREYMTYIFERDFYSAPGNNCQLFFSFCYW